MVVAATLANLGPDARALQRLHVLSDRLHPIGVDLLDDTVHDRRVAKLALDDLELTHDVGRVLACEAREDRVALRRVAVARRATGRDQYAELIGSCHRGRNCQVYDLASHQVWPRLGGQK